jgi:hypothetical protein
MIRENLKVVQSQHKSYTDKRRDLPFKIGDFAYLKVSPMRGTRRFKVKRKLAPRFVGPFKIISHKGEVAYQLELPPQLSDVHDVFHVSQLKKCLRIPEEQLPMEELDLGGDLTYSERPTKILDMAEHGLVVRSLKCAKFSGVTIWTMKLPGSTKKNSEHIILSYSRALIGSRGRYPFKGGRFVIPIFCIMKSLQSEECISLHFWKNLY